MQNNDWILDSCFIYHSDGKKYWWVGHTKCGTESFYSNKSDLQCYYCKEPIPNHLKIQMRLLLAE